MTDMEDTGSIINKAAHDVLMLARNELMVNMRFLDTALSKLQLVPSDGLTLATNGSHLIYGPRHILRMFMVEQEKPAHDYLHVLLHCIYSHMFVGADIDRSLWDIACDIAAESTINDLGLRITGSERKAAQTAAVKILQEHIGMLTAEKIYHYYRERGIPKNELSRLRALFATDDHACWYKGTGAKHSDRGDNSQRNDTEPAKDIIKDAYIDNAGSFDMPQTASETEQEWKDIAEKVQEALETYFRGQGDTADVLMQNLREVNREKYDYTDFLRKFAVIGENPEVNDEEFDYILYTYGLQLYENMPLVEPLEYKEVKRVREFVIAIDTSGSTSGELVQLFLQKTYNILKASESYFSHVNIHIIQCDAVIQEHVRITSEEEFDSYIRTMSIHGLGGTDFRPVFSFVDELVAVGEFTDLKGLIYFTDGYGTFPARKPAYTTAFVFLDNEYNNPHVPPWAIRLVLEKEDIRR